MTRSRYSINEAIIRILRALEGKALTSDQPGVIPGEYLSENEAWSDLAELFEGSLPNETLHLPSAGIPFASVVEANAGTSNTVVMSPASHSWSHEYGGIYVSTGTASQSFTASSWIKITGAFQNFAEDSGGEINCDWNDDRIIINEMGTYFAGYNLSLYTDGDAMTTVDAEVFASGTALTSTRSRAQWIVTGSYAFVSGGNFIDIPVSGYYVDVRLNVSNTIQVGVNTAQLYIQKAVG